MRKFFRRCLILTFLLTFLLFASVLLAQESVVAVVNGRSITLDEWNREANINKLLVDIQNSNETFYQVLTTTQEGLVLIERYRLRILDTLIRKVAFVQFAESLKVAASDEEARKDVDNEIKKMLASLKMNEQQLNDYLLKLGMGTLDEYRLRLYFQRKYSLSLANVYVFYVEQEAKKIYEANKSKYAGTTMYDLVVLKFKDRASADNARQDLVRNVPLEDIAKKYNLTNYTNAFVRQYDLNVLPQSLWVYVTSVSKGTILPVQNVGGEFYVIRIKDVKISAQKSFEEAKEEIKKEILSSKDKQDEINSKIAKDFEEFFKKSKIEIRYKSTIVK